MIGPALRRLRFWHSEPRPVSSEPSHPLDQVERIDSRVSEEPANSFEDRGTEWNRQVIRGQRSTRHNVLRNGVRRHTTPELC